MDQGLFYWPCNRGNILDYCKVTFLIFLSFQTNYCKPFPTDNKNISVIHDERMLENIASGEYSYLIQFSDGTKLEQKGNLIPTNVPVEVGDNISKERAKTEVVAGNLQGVHSLQVSGSYAFIDPASGIKHEVKYIADKSGYHPHYIATFASGSHKTIDEHRVQEIGEGSRKKVGIAGRDDNDDSTPLPPLETISASLFSSQSETF